MKAFDDKWLGFLHCLLWRLKEIDTWRFHKIIYRLYEENLVKTNTWTWFGKWPRSPEVDATIALLEIMDVVEDRNDTLIVRRKPSIECRFDEKIEEIIKNVLKEK